VALAMMCIATTSLAAAAASDELSPGAGQGSGTTRFESDWVCLLDLPEGWSLFSALTDERGGEDLVEGPGGVSGRIEGGASERRIAGGVEAPGRLRRRQDGEPIAAS
jgi:hypothetical protein